MVSKERKAIASGVWAMASKAQRSVVRATLYALISDSKSGWLKWSAIVNARLSLEARVLLAWFALEALDEETASKVAEPFLFNSEAPLPPLSERVLEDARWWARGASPEEARAYCLACFEMLSEADRSQLADFIERRKAA